MIESDPIPAGENNFIRVSLIEDDYRIRITDLFGTILFELIGDEINMFHSAFTNMLLGIQEFKSLEQKKEAIRQSIKNSNQTNIPKLDFPKPNQTHVSQTDNVAYNYEIMKEPLELVELHPKLNEEELKICIKAVKEEKKLTRKVIIDGENLEQFILEAFDGMKITVSKIVNKCANASIAVLKEPLRRILDTMVQEGKILSTEETIKGSTIKYTLYAINYRQTTKKSSFETLLDKLEKEFTMREFVELAKKNGFQEQVALKILDDGYNNGELLQVKPHIFKKIE